MRYIRTKDDCITEGNFEIGKTIATLYGDEQITKENTADTIEDLGYDIISVNEQDKQKVLYWVRQNVKDILDKKKKEVLL